MYDSRIQYLIQRELPVSLNRTGMRKSGQLMQALFIEPDASRTTHSQASTSSISSASSWSKEGQRPAASCSVHSILGLSCIRGQHNPLQVNEARMHLKLDTSTLLQQSCSCRAQPGGSTGTSSSSTNTSARALNRQHASKAAVSWQRCGTWSSL